MILTLLIVLSFILFIFTIIFKGINDEKINYYRSKSRNDKDYYEEKYQYYLTIDSLLCFLGGTGIITFIISLILSVLILSFSYCFYLDNRSFYDSTKHQYRSQIKMYEGEVIIHKNEVKTDLVNMGYQKEISDKITKLTNSIVDYNESIIKKRILAKNIIFSWLIIEPDKDMKILSLN